MNRLGGRIRQYAFGDEDLTQEGLIAVWKFLTKKPDAPRHHLLREAKNAICNAYSRGVSVDSRKSEVKGLRDRGNEMEVVYLDSEESLYLCDSLRYSPDVLAVDRIAYESFRQSLSREESTLLHLMMETTGNPEGGRGSYRGRYRRETGAKWPDYWRVLAGLRWKFYQHFGDDYELRRFEATNEEKLRPR